MEKSEFSRRQLIRKSAEKTVAAAFVTVAGAPLVKGASLPVTPAQTEGPFYPVEDQIDKDADMTQVEGHEQRAEGEIFLLQGRVLNTVTGAPIEGALVEFWQACASGKYQHPNDPNPAALDPHFQYWAQVRTDAQGHFDLKTIIPGAYPAEDDWMRPPHIHVKVHARGFPSLTTQFYFAGHPLNDRDYLLQRLTPEQQRLVVPPRENGRLVNRWDIFLLPRSRAGLTWGEVKNTISITPEL